MNRYFFIGISLACLSFYSHGANIFTNTMSVYTCTNEEAARNCKNCEFEKNVSLRIDINVEKSIVIQTLFEEKKNIGGGALDDCKIVDKKNWQCGNDGSYNEFNTYSKSKQAMSNGIYHSISILRARGIPKANIPPTNSETYFCAK